jgi:hypothetical protein
MTCNTFASWFENGYVPSVRHHLPFKKLKTLLLLDHCPDHPSADVLKSKERRIKAMCLLRDNTALIQPMDQGIIQAFSAYYCGRLRGRAVNYELQDTEFLETLTLKDAACMR